MLILLSIFLVAASFFENLIGSVITFGFIFAGIPVYFAFVRYKLVPTGFVGKCTTGIPRP